MRKKLVFSCFIVGLLALVQCNAQDAGVRLENGQWFSVDQYSAGGKSASGMYTCAFSLSQRDKSHIAKVKFRTPNFSNYVVGVYDQKSSLIRFGNNGLASFSVDLPMGIVIRNAGGESSPRATNLPADVEMWVQCKPKA